jgi:NAD(P)-dependent dehydrogenase (short-subunit alcohol dehydrogenase family)
MTSQRPLVIYYARTARMHDNLIYIRWRQYQQSKLMNILFVKQLAKRAAEKKVTAYALHPGKPFTDPENGDPDISIL